MKYHGSEKNRAIKAIEDQKLPLSIHTEDKEQWLGDGVYLYEEKFYAYRWIEKMHQSNIRKEEYDSGIQVLEKFMVLGVKIEYDKDREYRMSNLEHYITFCNIADAIKKKK